VPITEDVLPALGHADDQVAAANPMVAQLQRAEQLQVLEALERDHQRAVRAGHLTDDQLLRCARQHRVDPFGKGRTDDAGAQPLPERPPEARLHLLGEPARRPAAVEVDAASLSDRGGHGRRHALERRRLLRERLEAPDDVLIHIQDLLEGALRVGSRVVAEPHRVLVPLLGEQREEMELPFVADEVEGLVRGPEFEQIENRGHGWRGRDSRDGKAERKAKLRATRAKAAYVSGAEKSRR
jgi:hypothetical protein